MRTFYVESSKQENPSKCSVQTKYVVWVLWKSRDDDYNVLRSILGPLFMEPSFVLQETCMTSLRETLPLQSSKLCNILKQLRPNPQAAKFLYYSDIL